MAKIILWLWRLILIPVLLIGIARIITMQMAEYHESLIVDQDDPEIDKTLYWNPNSAKALYLLAKRVSATNPQLAAELAQRSYVLEPVNGQALMLLAHLSRTSGDLGLADSFAQQAAKIQGANPLLLLDLAEYWDKRNQTTKVISAISSALTAKPSLQDSVFPLLLKVAENPTTRIALVPLTYIPPPWWDEFYRYLAIRAISVDTLNIVLAWRHNSKIKLSPAERIATADRFIKEKLWPEAYLYWANSLTKEQMPYLGGVFNGGFELPASNYGFDWHLPNSIQGIKITQDSTYGIQGNLALHLRFEGSEIRFAHVYQYLFLNAGEYRFSIQARTDSLQGRGGLVWSVSCVGDTTTTPVGETDRLIGSNDWRSLTMEFSIPEHCLSQILRLRSVGDTLYDNRLEGDAWFDQAQIFKLRQ